MLQVFRSEFECSIQKVALCSDRSRFLSCCDTLDNSMGDAPSVESEIMELENEIHNLGSELETYRQCVLFKGRFPLGTTEYSRMQRECRCKCLY